MAPVVISKTTPATIIKINAANLPAVAMFITSFTNFCPNKLITVTTTIKIIKPIVTFKNLSGLPPKIEIVDLITPTAITPQATLAEK